MLYSHCVVLRVCVLSYVVSYHGVWRFVVFCCDVLCFVVFCYVCVVLSLCFVVSCCMLLYFVLFYSVVCCCVMLCCVVCCYANMHLSADS